MTAIGAMKRGYTLVDLAGKPTITGASTETNVLVKKQLPARGIVSSNPNRAERLLKMSELSDVEVHTDSGWGVKIWTATLRNVVIFVAVVPIGSTGAGFAFFEMYAAGAQAILRFGAGSDRERSSLPRELAIVDQASSIDVSDKLENASATLIKLLTSKAVDLQMPMKKLVCYNVEDYHAYNFSELFENGPEIQKKIKKQEGKSDKECCWDMETSALFGRAFQFGRHAVTVLVPVEPDLALEKDYYRVMIDSLLDFSPAAVQEHEPANGKAIRRTSLPRHSRLQATNDLIGVEDPLFDWMDDVRTGNGLFNDDDE